MNAYRASNLIEINTLARSARVKMIQECRRPEMNLIRVVGHANTLDYLKHATLQAHLEIIKEAPTKKKPQQVQTTTQEVICESVEEADDIAMTFESTPYSTQQSTVSVVSCEDMDDDSSSDTSDTSEDEFSFHTEPTLRSKPIAIPQPKVSVTAVEC